MKQKQQLPDRPLEPGKKKGISQQDLAQLAKVRFTNVGSMSAAKQYRRLIF
jgi:hypothetical protein